ncbi:MAG: hypothetical protein AAGK78_11780 [Planctomycetota bacterium]
MPRPVKFAGRLFAFSLLPLLLVFPILAFGMRTSVSVSNPASDELDAVETTVEADRVVTAEVSDDDAVLAGFTVE